MRRSLSVIMVAISRMRSVEGSSPVISRSSQIRLFSFLVKCLLSCNAQTGAPAAWSNPAVDTMIGKGSGDASRRRSLSSPGETRDRRRPIHNPSEPHR
ncbi:hypothetical protein THIOKS1560009 [Thiocapsa sp. KS1]|nr:hypothetical protein THIOKS1560009 [Thiocapsa sp. KS1]